MPLRRADRLFDIIRILRAASQPVTAAAIADELEVTVRSSPSFPPKRLVDFILGVEPGKSDIKEHAFI